MLRALLLLLLAGCSTPPDSAPTFAFASDSLSLSYEPATVGPLGQTLLMNLGTEPVVVVSLSVDVAGLSVVTLGNPEPTLEPGASIAVEVSADEPLPITRFDAVLAAAALGADTRPGQGLHIAGQVLRLEPLCDQDADGSLRPKCEGDDCNEADPEVHPGMVEVCDGIDRDCSGDLDEVDADADGWWICEGDCDDTNPDVHPTLPEACDLLDTDCDGVRSEDELDLDGDGYGLCHGDCDDEDPNSASPEDEVCNGVDDDCGGLVDEGFLRVPEQYESIEEALWERDPDRPICLGPGTWEAPGPWQQLRELRIVGRAGSGETTIDLGTAESSSEQIRAMDQVELEGLRFVGNRPLIIGSDARVVLRDLVLDEYGTPQLYGRGVLLDCTRCDVELHDLRVTGRSDFVLDSPLVRLIESGLWARDLEIADFRTTEPLMELVDHLEAEFEGITSRNNRGLSDGSTVLFDLDSGDLEVREWRADDNVGVEFHSTGGFHYFEGVSRRGSLGATVRAGALWLRLNQVDVRTDVVGRSPLVIAESGHVVVDTVILAGSFGQAFRWEGFGDGTVEAEHLTVVGSAGGEDVLAGNPPAGGHLELLNSAVTVGGPAAEYDSDPGVWDWVWGTAESTNIDSAVELAPEGHVALTQVPARHQDVSSADPRDWILRLSLDSPLIDQGTLTDSDGSPADLGAYGGNGARRWDLDADGATQSWKPGPWLPDYATDGLDCDDHDPEVFGTQGC